MNIERTTFGDIGHMQAARFSFFRFLKSRIDYLTRGYKKDEKDPKVLKEYLVKKYIRGKSH